MNPIRKVAPILLLTLSVTAAQAEDSGCDAACEAARKAANPLADTRAIMTDNTLAFKTGADDETS